MSRRQRGYPWPSLAISPYHSSPPAGLQGYILCPHIVAVCMLVLVVPLLHIHMWGSTGVHRLWARPCFGGVGVVIVVTTENGFNSQNSNRGQDGFFFFASSSLYTPSKTMSTLNCLTFKKFSTKMKFDIPSRVKTPNLATGWSHCGKKIWNLAQPYNSNLSFVDIFSVFKAGLTRRNLQKTWFGLFY